MLTFNKHQISLYQSKSWLWRQICQPSSIGHNISYKGCYGHIYVDFYNDELTTNTYKYMGWGLIKMEQVYKKQIQHPRLQKIF